VTTGRGVERNLHGQKGAVRDVLLPRERLAAQLLGIAPDAWRLGGRRTCDHALVDARSREESDLEPSIDQLDGVPREIARLRDASDRRNNELAEILTPRIEGQLLTLRTIIEELIAAHRRIGDTMDFGIEDDTRWTAVWEMSGRCLGLCNALLIQLREGFASEMVPTLRAIHEAGQLLTVLAGPGEEKLLRTWLEDNTYISASKARAAEARIAKPALELLKKEGITSVGDQAALGQKGYDLLSKPAQNMRIGFAESIARGPRQFSYGPHPSPIQRAIHVGFGSQLIEEVAMRVAAPSRLGSLDVSSTTRQ